jgi:glucokinase
VRVLAGDIGGTNARLAVFSATGRELQREAEQIFLSEEFDSLEEIVRRFAGGAGADCDRGCFGIAGPVRGRRVKTTNLPWTVEADALADALRVPADGVFLINDLEANAWGIPTLEPDDLVVLRPGAEGARGNRALIAAGTGLGEAGLYWDGRRHRPFATEGGHADFAPRDEVEMALHRHLAARHAHVSWERVVSGPGLVDLYRFLVAYRKEETPGWLEALMTEGDAAAAIARAGLEGRSERCTEALDRFASLYGAEAGNLALKTMARGGAYVGGGIAPKILPKLREGPFVEAFLAKGRMRSLLEDMPLAVITNDSAALRGAARFAATGGGAEGDPRGGDA